MPELPEVETIRLGLQKYIVGKTIEDIEVRLPKILTGDPKDIVGAKVIDVRRFGKGLVIDLDNQYSIAIHIKLTGQLIYRGKDALEDIHLSQRVGGELPNKWTHVISKLKSQKSKVKNEDGENAYLYYNDIRQFGWIKIIQSSKLKDEGFFKDLGPEFFKDLTFEKFEEIVKHSNGQIKPLLMDQKRMSGVGNIYGNDALFEARIDPRRSALLLTQEEAKRLYNSVLKVLKKGLEQGGATEINFVNVLGQEGGYQNHFLVYGREGEMCKNCGGIIKKIKLGGRGTYFCEKCQE